MWEKVAPGEAVQGEADMKGGGHPMARKNHLCIYHAKGECTRGSLCTWAHCNREIGQVVVDYKQLGVKLDMCRHFLAGACWAGADCAWAHSEEEQMAPMVYKKMDKITQWQGRFFWKDKTQWSGWQECDPPGARHEGRRAGANARSSTDHAGGGAGETQQRVLAEMNPREEVTVQPWTDPAPWQQPAEQAKGKPDAKGEQKGKSDAKGEQKGQTDAQDAWLEKGGGSKSRESNLSPAAKGEQKGKSDKGPERWICPTCGRRNQTGNTCYCFAEKGKSKGQTHGDALMGQERWQWRQRHVNEEAHVLEDGAAARCPGHAVDEEGPAQPPLTAPEEDEDEDEKSADDEAAPPPMGGEDFATGLIFDARGLLVEDEEEKQEDEEEDEHEDEHDDEKQDEEKQDEEKQDEEKQDENEEEKQDERDDEDEDEEGPAQPPLEEDEYEDEEDEYEQPAEVEEAQPDPEPELEQWSGEEVEAPYRIAQHRLIVMPPPPCQTCQGSPCWCTKNQRRFQR